MRNGWAESIREIGILLVVFLPLDVMIERPEWSWQRKLLGLGIGLLGFVLIQLGIMLEEGE